MKKRPPRGGGGGSFDKLCASVCVCVWYLEADAKKCGCVCLCLCLCVRACVCNGIVYRWRRMKRSNGYLLRCFRRQKHRRLLWRTTFWPIACGQEILLSSPSVLSAKARFNFPFTCAGLWDVHVYMYMRFYLFNFRALSKSEAWFSVYLRVCGCGMYILIVTVAGAVAVYV